MASPVLRPFRLFLIAACLAAPEALTAQEPYRTPPEPILRCLEAPPPPSVRVSPDRRHLLLVHREGMPSIADLSRPVLRLAGRRIDPGTFGPQRRGRNVGFTLLSVETGESRDLAVPEDADLSGPMWSPGGERFAFTQTRDDGIELWVAEVAEVAAGAVRRVEGVRLNATMGNPVAWMPCGGKLAVRVVAAEGAAPERPRAPTGPVVLETEGEPAPVRTFQDLLGDPHDEALYEHYMASRLVLVDLGGEGGDADRGATVAPLGEAGLITSHDPSPDGRHLLVTVVQRPFSYVVPDGRFPRNVEVWDLSGALVRRIAELPLAETIPIQGVREGPRGVRWIPTRDAELVWVEALDGGDPRRRVEHRDRLLRFGAPFKGEPEEWLRLAHRFTGLSFCERDEVALATEFERDRRWTRTWRFDPKEEKPEPELLFERSAQDRYGDPGSPVMRRNERGEAVIHRHGTALFLSGDGATPEGDRPFLDRLDLETGATERLFHCGEGLLERPVALLADDASRLLVRRESPEAPPNDFVLDRAEGRLRRLTDFTDPAVEITRGITRELLTYEREDGVALSGTLYLPPGHREGDRLPLLVWAYPREFTDPGTAGQVGGSPHRYTRLSGSTHLFFLLVGWAVLDGATMPVVGHPETANDTFVEQIVASARAAIETVVEMGVADPERVAVGGHSYGAFMTANLLAHSDLFRAGIARSGAYNRTLTPFGFQSERRTLWEASEIYIRVSPFLHAHRIRDPILLLHGEADNNSGTFPMQSERLYHAILGNGGTARLVLLPFEGHGYAARESVQHVLWEMTDWLDRHVLRAGPRAPAEPSPAAGRRPRPPGAGTGGG